MLESTRNKIEDIKRRLYDREDTTTHRHSEGVIHPQSFKVASDWKDDSNKEDSFNKIKKPPTSIFKKFFIGSAIFFICALGFAIYMFSGGGASVSNDKIDIIALGNAFTEGGTELPIQIEIVNNNNADLELANLFISYPRGASDNNDIVRLPRDSIGTIKKGQSVTRNVKVTLFGDEKSTRNVTISLEYHPQGSNAIFTKEKQYSVTINSAPLSLLIDAPSQATSDQDISLKITSTLNTSLPGGQTILQIAYPNNFVFEGATPSPFIGNSVWSLNSLTTTNPVSITVKGRLIGQDGDQQIFHVYAGAPKSTDQSVVNVVYNSLLQTMTITKPFLETHILVNGEDSSSYTASGGEKVHGQISWVNNLPTQITDAQIIVTLSGNAFNKTAVDPVQGFYDSSKNQIIWDKNTVSSLGSLEPGSRGIVDFTFKPISLVGSSSSITQPQVELDVSIKGSQPSLGSTLSDVNNFSKKIIKIASDFQIASSAVYSGGSMPPKAETETIYNVTWTLSNSANSITGAAAKSSLPIYVNWAGPAAGNNENVSYNESTREVSWNIGTVNPNTGFNSNREASFLISFKPSILQVGSIPQLMKDVFLSGQDSFTGTQIKSSHGPITIQITNDPNFKTGDERVIN
jgi:hypothetical protein